MYWNSSSLENLRRIFTVAFTVRDIAEPLVSFDVSAPSSEVRTVMNARGFDVVGVRREGAVVGFVERAALGPGVCGETIQSFDPTSLISDSTPLADVILGLDRQPRLFVRVLGGIGGIVTQADVQKPPIRMWLFGMITLIEMRMGRLIEQLSEGDTWQQSLSEGRLQKAAELLDERRRRSQSLTLLDCLQFADKAQVIARNERLRAQTRFTSRRQVEEACRAMENLRNNLAHSQDILATDWPTIVLLSAELDGVIGGPPPVQARG